MIIDNLDMIARDLKKKHGRVFQTVIGRHVFLWRELTRHEYADILIDTREQYDLEERICQAAVLYPQVNFREVYPGATPTLATQIVEQSGFGQSGRALDVLEQYREQLKDNFIKQAETVIKMAFPHISYEEMKEWTIDRLMETLARAEWGLKTVHDITLPFQTKEEEKKDEDAALKETVTKMRQDGVDPMLAFGKNILVKKPYVDMPLIGGTEQWRNEVVLDGIRQQIQAVSK